MALGADAVYIGSIALIALQTQAAKTLATEQPRQVPIDWHKFKEGLDVDKGAEHLAKFLKSSVEEMKLVAYTLGKTDLAQINKMDLVTVDRDLAQVLRIDYAGFSPGKP